MSFVQFFESSWKERFNSVSHVQNRVNHWVLLLKKGFKMKKVQSFELYRKKRFNSLGHVKQKVQSIESIFEKVQFLESVFLSNFKSQSHIFQERSIQFILWVIHFAKKKKIFESFFKWVIFFDSCWKEGFNLNESYCSKRAQFCESCLKRVQICKKMWKKQKINSWSPFVKSVQFFESHSKKCSVLWVISEKIKPLGPILSNKKVHFFESVGEKSSLLWVNWRKKFNSLSYVESVRFCESYQKNSILCIISQNFNPFFGSYQRILHVFQQWFNSLGHIQQKRFNSLDHIQKRRYNSLDHRKYSIHWVLKKGFNSLSQLEKVHFFESIGEKSSILWVMLKSVRFCESYQKNSILCIISQNFNPFFGSNQRKFNPVGYIFKK